MESLSYSFLFLSFLAEIIGTIGGFGSSILFVPIGNLYFDFETVLGLTAVFHVLSNLSKIALFRKGLDKTLLLNLGIPSVLFVIIGALLTQVIFTKILEMVLGIFLIGLGTTLFIFKNLKFKANKTNTILGGTISGFLAGLIGTGGAIRGLTLASFRLEKSTFIASSAVIDFAVDSSRAIVYFFQGYIKMDILIYLPFLFIVAFIGTWVGKKILNHIPQVLFLRISLLIVIAAGLITLIQFI